MLELFSPTTGYRQRATGPVLTGADLFCGAGGWSRGLLEAFEAQQRRLDLLAINHDELACQSHALNHPETRTMKADLWAIDNPRNLVPGGKLTVLAASPECTNHSKAAAGRPRDDQSRSTMYQVHHWVTYTSPDVLLVENVPEARQWGPLLPNGKPDPEKKGAFYRPWFDALKAMYPNLTERVVVSADYGDPTLRKRLVLMGTLDGRPLGWAPATHGDPEDPATKARGLAPWRTAREIINWNRRGTLVRAKRDYFADKQERLDCIAAGLALYGGDPFVLRRNQQGNPPETNAKSVDRPLHTVTANGSDIALIVPRGRTVEACEHRMLLADELQLAMGFPKDFQFLGANKDAVRMIGNAVSVGVARAHASAALRHHLDLAKAA